MFINALKTGFLFFVLTALVLGGGFAIGGQRGLVFALAVAGVMNFVGYFFSAQIALMSMGAQEVGPEICGNPLYLASALEKLEMYAKGIPLETNPAFNSMFIIEPFNPMSSAAELFMTHPPTEKRIMNLIGRPSTGRNMR